MKPISPPVHGAIRPIAYPCFSLIRDPDQDGDSRHPVHRSAQAFRFQKKEPPVTMMSCIEFKRAHPGRLFGLLLAAAPIALATAPSAQAPPLDSAAAFAVLGASTVTNTGASAITGDLGVAPSTAIVGFPPGILTGSTHPGDAVAVQAQSDLAIAYAALVGATCTTTLTGQDLGGLTLSPGVYCFAAAAQLTGTLTLDGQGNSASEFIFQIGSTLTTTTASAVVLSNGARAANVFWQVGSSATLGATTAFTGNIIALASITTAAGTNVTGRLMARTAAVTMDTTSVTRPDSAFVNVIGPGCGAPAPVLGAVGLPILGNAAFALSITSAPGASVLLFFSFQPDALLLAPGCTQYLDSAGLATYGFFVADGAGTTPVPVPLSTNPLGIGLDVHWQAAEVVTGGPLFGSFALSNGLRTHLELQ